MASSLFAPACAALGVLIGSTATWQAALAGDWIEKRWKMPAFSTTRR